jgi:hypothetical protein
MLRLVVGGISVVAGALALFSPAPEARQRPSTGRAVTIEDYYRIQTIGNPSISPAGTWVAFTITTRREEPTANSNRTETYLVPADASAEPKPVQHQGKDVSNPGWSDDGLLQYTADGAVESRSR